jgi:Flp pilus assembly protein TadD
VAFGLVYTTNAARATVFAKRASEFTERREWGAAQAWYAAAAAADPFEPSYADSLTLALLQEAQATTDGPTRRDRLRDALSLAERGARRLNPDSARVLAQVHLAAAELARDDLTRTGHLDAADTVLEDLARRRPTDPSVWSLRALVDLGRGNDRLASEKVRHALWLRHRSSQNIRLRDSLPPASSP